MIFLRSLSFRYLFLLYIFSSILSLHSLTAPSGIGPCFLSFPVTLICTLHALILSIQIKYMKKLIHLPKCILKPGINRAILRLQGAAEGGQKSHMRLFPFSSQIFCFCLFFAIIALRLWGSWSLIAACSYIFL